MIEQSIRHHYQRLLVDPVASFLAESLAPNQVTVLSAVFGLMVLPALMFQQVSVAIVLLLLSGYCDTLDGTLARLNGTTSEWGSVLDIMADRFVEFTVVLALFLQVPGDRGLWCLLMLGSMLLCITSFLVVGIFSNDQSEKSFDYSPGLMERAEAFMFFIAMMLWPNAFIVLSVIFSLLVLLTAIIRLVQFYRQQAILLKPAL